MDLGSVPELLLQSIIPPGERWKCCSCCELGARKSAFVMLLQCFGFTVPTDLQALGFF